MINEIWKWIPGYEGEYQASSLGRIKSFKVYKYGRIMQGNILKDGRQRVNLNGQKQLVHRLILKTFDPLGETTEQCLALHLDGNPTNNNITNLAWGSYKDNAQDELMFKRCSAHREKTKASRDEAQIVRFEGEEWKDIPNYNGDYQISSRGRVRSLKRKTPLIMSPILGRTQAYYSIGLTKNGLKTQYSINRLVAEAFIPNPMNLPEVNHIDENTLNNNVENLEWVSHAQNVQHSAHRQSYPVLQYDCEHKFIAEYPSLAEAERQTGIYRTTITRAIKRGDGKAGGYIWHYK